MKNLRLLFALIIISPLSYSQNLEEKLDEVKYRNIGPFRGGRSVSSVGVIGDPLTYYMGTVGGGLWKTTNAGVNWFNISDDYFKTSSVGAIAVADSDSRIIYVGMGEHAPRGVMTSYGDGVYKSTDAGKTWEHMGLKDTQQISRIIIHPDNPNIVFVAAQGAVNGPTKDRGIYKSVDGGTSWKNMGLKKNDGRNLEFMANLPGRKQGARVPKLMHEGRTTQGGLEQNQQCTPMG